MPRGGCSGPREEAQSSHQGGATGCGWRNLLAAQERIPEQGDAILEFLARAFPLANHRLREESGTTGHPAIRPAARKPKMTRYGEVCSFPSREAPPMEAPYFHNGSKGAVRRCSGVLHQQFATR